jgi:predicted DNA-binding protein YlxM (UPF0122 family)
MSRLIKPVEYAKSQGISRQAVYAKIKKGLLNSKTIDGKIYIILESELSSFPIETRDIESVDTLKPHLVDVKELLNSKEETISILKESISDLKQTNTEINTTLRGEIELLKQVFTEMRNLYVKQVDYMSIEKNLELENNEYAKEEKVIYEKEKECWITVNEFFERLNITKKKKKKKILKRLEKIYKREDPRVKKESEVLYLHCDDFYKDILKISS